MLARLRGQRAAAPLLALVAVALVGLAGLRWRDPAGAQVDLGYGCTPSLYVSCPGGVPPGVTTPMQTSTPISLAHLLSVVKKLRVRPPPPFTLGMSEETPPLGAHMVRDNEQVWCGGSK